MIVILVFYDTEYHVADDIKLDWMLSRILKNIGPCIDSVGSQELQLKESHETD